MRLTSMLIVSTLVIIALTCCASLQGEKASFTTKDPQSRDVLSRVPFVTVKLDPDFEKQVEQEVAMMRTLKQDQQYLNEIEDEKKRMKKAVLFETLTDEQISTYGYTSKCKAWYDIAMEEKMEFERSYDTAKKMWQVTECGLREFAADIAKMKATAGHQAVYAEHLGGLKWLSNSLNHSYLAPTLVQAAAAAGCVGYETGNVKLLGAYYGALRHYAYFVYYTKKFEKCGSS